MPIKSIPTITDEQEERFWRRVEVHQPAGCWQWTGTKTVKGYGSVRLMNRADAYVAHRVSYTLLVGEIPSGLVLDHLCQNRLCVNPDHLEPVTIYENTRRAYRPPYVSRKSTKKSHCVRGHELTPENRNKVGRCRLCRSVIQKQWEAKGRRKRKPRVTL